VDVVLFLGIFRLSTLLHILSLTREGLLMFSKIKRTVIRLSLVVLFVIPANLRAEEEVREIWDLSYKTNPATEYEQTRCKLDLYLPARGKDTPAILWFHGGSLQHGDKRGEIEQTVGRYFASQGVIFASANYRLHPAVNFPAYVEDAAAAFAFLHQAIPAQGGNPERLFVSGHSAGGYLSAMISLDPRFLEKHKLRPSQIAGVIPITGQMATHSTIRKERGLPETQPMIDAAAPAFHVTSQAPPFLVIAGSEDLPARAEENRYFVALLKAVGHPDATYLEVAGRNHGTVASSIATVKNDPAAVVIRNFLQRLSR